MVIPDTYPDNKRRRHYVFASSANPDAAPVYTNTLALRREVLPDGSAYWNFWTTAASGEASRDELRAADTLTPGPHHLAITWDQASGHKALYLDGKLAAAVSQVALPDAFGSLLDLGRFSPGGPPGGIMIDDLAVFGRELGDAEIARLARSGAPPRAGADVVTQADIAIDLNASDDAGGIVRVEIGIDGMLGDPQPFADAFSLTLPSSAGPHTITARVYDRAGNMTVVSNTIILQHDDARTPPNRPATRPEQ